MRTFLKAVKFVSANTKLIPLPPEHAQFKSNKRKASIENFYSPPFIQGKPDYTPRNSFEFQYLSTTDPSCLTNPDRGLIYDMQTYISLYFMGYRAVCF